MNLPWLGVPVRCWIVACAAAQLAAAEAVQSPVPPQQSLRHIVLEPGFVAELVACEPDVIDPVAMRFDEDGRIWVVQMRDYPTADTPGIRSRSRVSVLEDRDGDGFFETAAVFADDLAYATGLQPWRGGVFVTQAGRVAYLKDTTGDGKADLEQTWYTGFSEGNTQLRANHPTLAIDNHIYVASGLRGGAIVDARADPHFPAGQRPVALAGRDFRFDPRTGSCEAVSGVGQFGLAFDDAGNRFVCSNRNPAVHVVLEDRALRKNPLVAISAVANDVARSGDESRVYPIGRSWTTSHRHAGQFTAACGLHVYRGDAFPAGHRGNLFVCEPTGHLVHREVIRPAGVTFAATPAVGVDDQQGEATVEFFASRDEWCTPVSLEVGPDGGLYVVDMYRAVIEHPEWMPDELRERPDLALGSDHGRIYRIVPVGRGPSPVPRLSALTSRELVPLVGHPNVWHREAAARLLLERADSTVTPALERLVLSDQPGQARIRALRLLEGLAPVREEILIELLAEADPRLVEQAILVSEPRCRSSAAVRAAVSRLIRHPDARVRFQALLAATPLPGSPAWATDRWELDAMLIAAGDRGGEVLEAMLREREGLAAHVAEPKRFIADLARLAAAADQAAQDRISVECLAADPGYRRVGLAGFLAGVAARGESVDSLRTRLAATGRALDAAFREARTAALDVEAPDSERGEAIDLLAFDGGAADVLTAIALDDRRIMLRPRAIAALARSHRPPEQWRLLLERFGRETPAVKAAILDGLSATPACTILLLDEIAAGRIKPVEVDAARTSQLLRHRDASIRDRAATLFGNAVPADREQALAAYQTVLTLPADPARGRGIFERHCASCHRIAGLGTPLAPDISDARDKSVAQLLTDIIQPNRAVDSNSFRYTAVTVDGLVHSGVVVAETSTSVTLRQPAGKQVSLRRDEIEELKSDGVSFMPDGIERAIPPQEMADLIGFVKHWRHLGPADQSPPASP